MDNDTSKPPRVDAVGPGEYRNASKESFAITLSQFGAFMTASGRRNRCPGCDFDEGWIIHGYNPKDIGGDPGNDGANPDISLVKVYHLPALHEPHNSYPVICAECPRCGLVQTTSAARVLRHAKEGE